MFSPSQEERFLAALESIAGSLLQLRRKAAPTAADLEAAMHFDPLPSPTKDARHDWNL